METSNMKVRYPGIENNLTANQANIISEFKKSLGLPV